MKVFKHLHIVVDSRTKKTYGLDVVEKGVELLNVEIVMHTSVDEVRLCL